MRWSKSIVHQRIWYAVALIILLSCLGFVLANIGQTEVNERSPNILKPDFNSSLYDALPAQLSFSSKEQVYYTIDGSTPRAGSDRTREYLDTKSLRFYAKLNDYLSAISTSPIWKSPRHLKKRGLVLKMSIRDDQGRFSEPVVRQFLPRSEKHDEGSLPTIGLVIDPDDMFRYDKGLFIQGQESYRKTAFEDERLKQPGWYRYWTLPANYHTRGAASRRPIFISYFNERGDLEFEGNGVFRLKGDASRALPQKALLIQPEDRINRKTFFQKSEDFNLNKILLRSSGGDFIHTMLRDALSQKLIQKTSLEEQSYRAVTVYLNGEYWGIQNLREEVDVDHLLNKYNLARSDLEYVELSMSKFKKEEAWPSWKKTMEDLSLAIDAGAGIEKLRECFEISELADYFAIQCFIANTDWPNNNVKAYRILDDHPQQGKWRFLIYDTDFAYAGSGDKEAYNYSMHQHILESGSPMSDFYRLILSIPEFKSEYLVRYKEHLNGFLSNSNTRKYWSECISHIEQHMSNHIDRWSIPESMESWRHNLELVDSFLLKRNSFALQEIKELSKP